MHLPSNPIQIYYYFFDLMEVFGLLAAVFLLPDALEVLAFAAEEDDDFFLACVKTFKINIY